MCGQKHVHVVNSGKKEQVTVLACASASGYILPPMIVYKRKNLTPQLRAEEVDVLHMDCPPVDGWMGSYFMSGSSFTFFSMHLLYRPCFYFWMVTHLTTGWNLTVKHLHRE